MSRFVSAGTTGDPEAKDDEWAKVQQELDENQKRKAEQGRQEGGKTLYEVLQANKAAKQEAFEESIRLKNQFRSLDEDEADFLDSVLETDRVKRAAIKKETSEQLEAFRKQQEEAERKARAEDDDAGPVPEEEQWTIGKRKRTKGREKEGLKGIKLRRTSTAEKPGSAETGKRASNMPEKPAISPERSTSKDQIASAKPVARTGSSAKSPAQSPTVKVSALPLGLGYSSSEED